MGGNESSTMKVEEIRKSKSPRSLHKSPSISNSKVFKKSAEKVIYPSPHKYEHDDLKIESKLKRSGSLLNAHKESIENTTDSRTKKKIKSVKVLPPALKNSSGIENMEEFGS